MEHADPKRRGLMATAPQVGLVVGLLLSTVTFLLLDLLPADAFGSWGRRVPFLLGASLVLVGMLIRLRISETPGFARLQSGDTRSRVPIMETLATRWRTVVPAALAFANVGAIFYALFTRPGQPQFFIGAFVVGFGYASWAAVRCPEAFARNRPSRGVIYGRR
ncbi:hypothetical protein [Nocardia brevicatena]|uniref:hypothetical protein n=1 Tax=Nocardia brevicatena TaxID=37327 RepID=UPI0012F9438E|nr:hypothetical protein [Nocardia brevicatena]